MNEPTFESFFSIPEWLGTQMVTALSGIFMITVLSLFFHIRAGSSYGLIGRLYAMLIGGSEFHHNSVAEFWREQKDVERFNALFNTKTKSLKEIQKFTSWLKNNELQPRKFTGLRDWLDFEKTKVKKIKIWHVVVPPVFLFLIFSFAFLFTAFACINSALISFDNEKQWMWLSHTEARSFSLNFFQDRSNSWSIDEYMCSNSDFNPEKMANTSRLQKDTVRTICKSFNNAEDTKHIDKIIADQKTLLLPALFLWFFVLISFIETRRIAAAMSARRYLRNRLKKVRLLRKVLVSSC